MLLIASWAIAGAPAGAAGRFTIETDHFYVHFDEGYEALAREAARIAEEVHRELAPRVGHVPSEKTHLVLLDTTDLANGFSDPMLYPKIVIYPVYPTHFSPYGSGISPRLREWMRLVILHEYAHALHLDMKEGLSRALEALFGRVPFLTNPMLLQSYALIEGFATYQETVADLGGRGHDPYYDMFLRTMVLEDDILRLDQVLGHYPLERWKPGGIVYLYGYALWEYMAERYGEEVLERFNRTFASTESLDETFERVLGVPADRFYREWRAHLRRKYRPQIESLLGRGITATEPLGGEGYVPQSPVASPDGRRLAYATVNGPVAPGLRLMEPGEGSYRDRQLAAGIIAGPVAWSPDGQSLYYAKIEAEGGTTFADLYAYDLATGRERRLTRGLRAFGPAPSPDGQRLAFTSREGLATRLLVLDLDGQLPAGPDSENLHLLLPAEGERQVLASAWSPDGSWILVSSHEFGGGMDLLRLDPQSGTLEPLVVGSRSRGGAGVVHQNAQFTPDGRFILYDSDQSGVYELYAYELASGATFGVARTLTGLFDPTVIQTDSGPALVAMEYTAGGYRLSRLPYDPEAWEHPPKQVVAKASLPEGPSSGAGGPLEKNAAAGAVAPPGHGAFQGAVRPYSPWNSLRPRFVLPYVGQDEAGLQVGAMTFSYDAYQERLYVLAAAHGVYSGRPSFLGQYTGPLFGSPQALWGIGARQETFPDPEGWTGRVERELLLDLSYTWPGILAGTSLTATAQVWDEQPVAGGAPAGTRRPGQALRLQASHLRVWPVDRRSFDLESSLGLTAVRAEPGWERQGFLATWREKATLSWNLGRRSLDAELMVGGSTLADAFHLGDGTDRLPAGSEQWILNAGADLEGAYAARLVVGLNGQLARITRGWGTLPVFFDDVGGRLYVEGGAAWQGADQAAQTRWGAGAEANLTTYLSYAMPLTLSVGVAVPIDPPDGSARVYVRVDLTDPLGGPAWADPIRRRVESLLSTSRRSR